MQQVRTSRHLGALDWISWEMSRFGGLFQGEALVRLASLMGTVRGVHIPNAFSRVALETFAVVRWFTSRRLLVTVTLVCFGKFISTGRYSFNQSLQMCP